MQEKINEKIKQPMRDETESKFNLSHLNTELQQIRKELKAEFKPFTGNIEFIDTKILEATLSLMGEVAANQDRKSQNAFKLAEQRANDLQTDLKALKQEVTDNDRQKADKDRQREALIIQLETETKFQK